jgi:hypothetical protein
MSAMFNVSAIAGLRDELNCHPVYGFVKNLDDARAFMRHHVYSVWDFMSLLKYLQRHLAPTSQPWTPLGNPSVRRFVNEIVMEEESDLGLPDKHGNNTYASHFELYLQAMQDIGADTKSARDFVAIAGRDGVAKALTSGLAPAPAKKFMESTFRFIATDKPHVVAAAFALGREHIIPGMFRALLRQLEVTKDEAPAFHYYLDRHIHLDEDHHAPLSLLMLNELCGGDATKLKEAEDAAIAAINARSEFWAGTLVALTDDQLERVGVAESL